MSCVKLDYPEMARWQTSWRFNYPQSYLTGKGLAQPTEKTRSTYAEFGTNKKRALLLLSLLNMLQRLLCCFKCMLG